MSLILSHNNQLKHPAFLPTLYYDKTRVVM